MIIYASLDASGYQGKPGNLVDQGHLHSDQHQYICMTQFGLIIKFCRSYRHSSK